MCDTGLRDTGWGTGASSIPRKSHLSTITGAWRECAFLNAEHEALRQGVFYDGANANKPENGKVLPPLAKRQ
jgi:hypothetical protein